MRYEICLTENALKTMELLSIKLWDAEFLKMLGDPNICSMPARSAQEVRGEY